MFLDESLRLRARIAAGDDLTAIENLIFRPRLAQTRLGACVQAVSHTDFEVAHDAYAKVGAPLCCQSQINQA